MTAKRQGVAHRLAPEVERAVAQPQRLVDIGVLVEREGRRRRGREDVDLAHRQLDLAGRESRVDRRGVAGDDLAGDADHRLAAQLVRGGVGGGCAVGVEDELQQARAVAQVDED
jgi:hypothetical protein